MSQSLKTNQLTFIYNGSYRETTDYDSIAQKFDQDWAIALANGTGAAQANFAYQDQLTITASGTSTLNLFSLTDGHKNAIAPSIIKVFALRLNTSTDTAATMTVGGSTGGNECLSLFSDATDKVKVRRGGWLVFACTDATGYAVSNTNKNVLLTNVSSTQSIVIDVVIVGVK